MACGDRRRGGKHVCKTCLLLKQGCLLAFMHVLFMLLLIDGSMAYRRDIAPSRKAPAPGRLVLKVLGEEEAYEEGRILSRWYVQDIKAEHPCTQEELDKLVVAGKLPGLEFPDEQSAKRFADLQRSHRSMELCIQKGSTGVQVRLAEEDKYTQSYSDVSVHELMLKDRARCEWYRSALERILKQRPGLVVLDVGAGTGLLAMFAARAGARKVYAVESSAMASIAQVNVFENGMNGVVDVLHSKVEQVKLPEKVDLIVSEWMGHYLLHESMIDSIIFAREHFLKEGGLMLPSSARILVAPVAAHKVWEERVGFWCDEQRTWGLNLRAVQPAAIEQMISAPMVASVSDEQLLDEAQVLWQCNMYNITCGDVLRIAKDMTFRVNQTMRGACIWFEVSEDISDSVLSTAPSQPETHWKQTLGKVGARPCGC
eukprot:753622-Hanusia_phi.AAC.3